MGATFDSPLLQNMPTTLTKIAMWQQSNANKAANLMHAMLITYQTDLNFELGSIIYPTIASVLLWQLSNIRKDGVGSDRITAAKHQFRCSIGCCAGCKWGGFLFAAGVVRGCSKVCLG